MINSCARGMIEASFGPLRLLDVSWAERNSYPISTVWSIYIFISLIFLWDFLAPSWSCQRSPRSITPFVGHSRWQGDSLLLMHAGHVLLTLLDSQWVYTPSSHLLYIYMGLEPWLVDCVLVSPSSGIIIKPIRGRCFMDVFFIIFLIWLLTCNWLSEYPVQSIKLSLF